LKGYNSFLQPKKIYSSSRFIGPVKSVVSKRKVSFLYFPNWKQTLITPRTSSSTSEGGRRFYYYSLALSRRQEEQVEGKKKLSELRRNKQAKRFLSL